MLAALEEKEAARQFTHVGGETHTAKIDVFVVRFNLNTDRLPQCRISFLVSVSGGTF